MPAMKRLMINLVKDRGGATAIEFAFVAPLLLLMIVGAAQFGITLNNYIELTEAVSSGARTLSVSRGSTAPYSTTVTQMQSSASALASKNLKITITVNGTACTSDSTCSTALTSAAGQPAAVAATYPCKLVVMGHDFAPNCTLSSTTTERVE